MPLHQDTLRAMSRTGVPAHEGSDVRSDGGCRGRAGVTLHRDRPHGWFSRQLNGLRYVGRGLPADLHSPLVSVGNPSVTHKPDDISRYACRISGPSR
jgi:hypothetical protein